MYYLAGKGPKPPRLARVIVYRGSANPSDIMEYQVRYLRLKDAWGLAKDMYVYITQPNLYSNLHVFTHRWDPCQLGLQASSGR